MFRLCYKQNKPSLIQQYKFYSNKLNKIKRIAKQHYYENEITKQKHEANKKWKVINEILCRNRQTMASISSVTNPETQTNSISITGICNILNKNFTDIGPRMDAGIDSTSQNFLQNLPSLPNFICYTDITPDEVLLKLRLLDCKSQQNLKIFQLNL